MKKRVQLYVLREQETWQYRKAQSISESFGAAMRRLCVVNTAISSCFLLDARQSEGSDVKLVIALLLENEEQDLVPIGSQVQELLRAFPLVAQKTVIMSAKPFLKDQAGAEFYVRAVSVKDLVRN